MRRDISLHFPIRPRRGHREDGGNMFPETLVNISQDTRRRTL
jgi:hypothetical protein